MSYQVIARKYRPQKFSDVVGQEHVTQTLSNAIKQKRIAHAYLFVGPRGTGKTTIARIFAKCLNCTAGPSDIFPDTDPRCIEITEGRSLDVLEIDGASNRGIEEIRELRDTVKYAPASSRFKIYIIDEVHMLTKEAFNALLKTLEEPPEHVKFMFATTEPEKVLPTILSRCQRFDLRRIPSNLIVSHLAHIAALENVAIDEPALLAIARGSEGCMRDAESTLDQLISFCGNTIVENDVLSMFGLTARSQVLSLASAIITADAEAALRELNDLARNGKDLLRLLSDLLNHFRNILIYQVSRGDLQLLEVPESEGLVLSEQASAIKTDSLTRVMEVLTEAESRLRDAASKKIYVEVMLLKAIQARNAVSVDLVLQKLQELRSSAGGSASAPAPAMAETLRPAAPPAARTVPAPPPSLAANTGVPPAPVLSQPVAAAPASAASTPSFSGRASVSGEDLERLWKELVDAVGRASPFTRTYLIEAHPVSFEKGVLVVGYDPEFADHLSLVDNPKNRTLLQTKLREFGFADAGVKFIQADAPPGRKALSSPPPEPPPAAMRPKPPPPAAEPRKEKPAPPPAVNLDDFKNDPLIKKALEVFKGQIVEVRV